MTYRRRATVWPYLCVLACLFGMCVTAPRSWRQTTRSWRQTTPKPARVAAAVTPLGCPRHKTPGSASLPCQPGRQASCPRSDLKLDSTRPSGGRDETSTPPVAPPAALILARPDLEGNRLAVRESSRPDAPQLRLPRHTSTTPSLPPATTLEWLPTAPSARPTDTTPEQTPDWPEWSPPATLLARLDDLAALGVAVPWARTTAGHIRRLTSGQYLDVHEVTTIFDALRAAANAAFGLAERADSPAHRTKLLQVQHGLTRRLDVWQPVLAARQAMADGRVARRQPDRQQLSRCLAQVALLTDNGTREGDAWREYLMLNALEAMVEPTPPADDVRAVARQVLKRLACARLTRAQRRLVEQAPLAVLDQQLRRWAEEPVDLRILLADLERYESTGSPRDARQVAEHLDLLGCAAQSDMQDLGRHIDQHYRNANLRVAISGDLINRCVPTLRRRQQAVRETIAGSDVTGRSRVSTQLFVRLLPDPRRIRVGLEASGTVHSTTVARSGPAAFHSTGRTTYLARKLLLIKPDGMRVWPAVAEADNDNRLLAVETNFDVVPLFSYLARRIARSQHDRRHDQAIREVESKVSNHARQRLDAEANKRLARIRQELYSRTHGRFDRLAIDAVPLDIHSTDRRMVVRIRVSGDKQLGAHTPRPRAPSDSQLSFQLHESAIQNLLSQLDLDGQQFTLPELYRAVADKFGQPDAAVPADLPAKAFVKFAAHDAVRFRCTNGQVQVTLAIAQLANGRQQYQNFQIVASYRPDPSGLHARLVRDGIIQLQGKRFRTKSQIVLRGVFAKLFPRNHPVHLLQQELAANPRLAGLRINQFVVQDGWIGVAVGPDRQRLSG